MLNKFIAKKIRHLFTVKKFSLPLGACVVLEEEDSFYSHSIHSTPEAVSYPYVVRAVPGRLYFWPGNVTTFVSLLMMDKYNLITRGPHISRMPTVDLQRQRKRNNSRVGGMRRITNRNPTPVDCFVVSSKIELPWKIHSNEMLWSMFALVFRGSSERSSPYFALSEPSTLTDTFISTSVCLLVPWPYSCMSDEVCIPFPSSVYLSALLRIHTRCCPPAAVAVAFTNVHLSTI